MAAKRKKTGGKTGGKRGGKRSTSFKPGNKTKSQWQPGITSPYPTGRPRMGTTWKDLIKAVGDELVTGKEKEYKDLKVANIMRREASVRKGYKFIAAGSYSIMKEFIEREEGKVSQPVDVTASHVLNLYMPKPLPEGADFPQPTATKPKNGAGKTPTNRPS